MVRAPLGLLRPLGRWLGLACLLISTPVLGQSPPAPGAADGALPIPLITPTAPSGAADGKQSSDTKVAEVEGRAITLADVHDLIVTLPPAVAEQDFQALYPRVIEQLVYRTVMAIRARAEGLDKDPQLHRRIEAATDHILANGWMHKHLDEEITEKMVLARYARDVGSQPPPEEVSLRIYIADSEKQAKDTIAAVRGGADFAALARASSKDPSAKDGGDAGFLPWSAVTPEVAGVAQGLATGELSPVPVRTRSGWVVFRLERRRAGTRPSFAEMREGLLEQMEQEQVRGLAENAMKGMIVRAFAINGAEIGSQNVPEKKPDESGGR